jgi:hypothetical protein
MALIPEIEPGFLSAAMVAAEMAGFDLIGLAMRENESQAQVHWSKGILEKRDEAHKKPGDIPVRGAAIQSAALNHLRERGEPGEYLHLHAAALERLSCAHYLFDDPRLHPAEVLSQVQGAIQESLAESGVFHRYGGGSRSLESGLWWLGEGQPGADQATEGGSLGDRVEMDTVNYLIHNPGCKFDDLQAALCEDLCGLLTPEKKLIEACLESYGEPEIPEEKTWQLRAEDAPGARRQDLRSMRALLDTLGERLGYQLVQGTSPEVEPVSPLEPLIWVESNGKPGYIFYVLASAVFGRIVFTAKSDRSVAINEALQAAAAPRRLLVIPGGRAGLVRYKLERDPRLAEAVAGGWEFVKFRHLRRLSEDARLKREDIGEKLLLDPLASDDPQMSLW